MSMSEEQEFTALLSRVDERLEKVNGYFDRHFGATPEERNRTLHAIEGLTPAQLREAARREKERLKG